MPILISILGGLILLVTLAATAWWALRACEGERDEVLREIERWRNGK